MCSLLFYLSYFDTVTPCVHRTHTMPVWTYLRSCQRQQHCIHGRNDGSCSPKDRKSNFHKSDTLVSRLHIAQRTIHSTFTKEETYCGDLKFAFQSRPCPFPDLRSMSHSHSTNCQENMSSQSQIEREHQVSESLSHSSDRPQEPQLWTTFLIVMALCLSVFLIALDYTIITTAIPRIT